MLLQSYFVSSLQWPKISTVLTLVYNNSFLITEKWWSSWMMKYWNSGPWPRRAHKINSKWPEDHNIYYRFHIDSVTFTIGHNRTSYIHFHTYRKRKIDFFRDNFRFFLCMINFLYGTGGCRALPGIKYWELWTVYI